MSAFNTYMEGQRVDRVQWHTYFPVQEVLLNDFNAEEKAVLLVDVGGGRGHDLEAFKEAFPHQEGRLIIQDLPDVIDDIRQPVPGVEAMKHNFFRPQPVKGLPLDHGCVDLMALTASGVRCKSLLFPLYFP